MDAEGLEASRLAGLGLIEPMLADYGVTSA
jgi:hypothetical protein